MCSRGKQHKTPDRLNKMNKLVGTLIIGFAIVGLIGLGVRISKPSRAEITVQNLKYDNCVTEMQRAIPDPNETEERSKFLEACYEN